MSIVTTAVAASVAVGYVVVAALGDKAAAACRRPGRQQLLETAEWIKTACTRGVLLECERLCLPRMCCFEGDDGS